MKDVTPRYVSTQWAGSPGPDGWYVVHEESGSCCLVELSNGRCATELGDDWGTPQELKNALWLGPLEPPQHEQTSRPSRLFLTGRE